MNAPIDPVIGFHVRQHHVQTVTSVSCQRVGIEVPVWRPNQECLTAGLLGHLGRADEARPEARPVEPAEEGEDVLLGTAANNPLHERIP